MNGREAGEHPLAAGRQVRMVDVCSPTDSAAFQCARLLVQGSSV